MTPYEILKNIIDLLFKNYDKRVIILVDNFEYPLIAAVKGGIIDPAYDFYQKIFPVELLKNEKINKIITMGMVHIEIPGTIYCIQF